MKILLTVIIFIGVSFGQSFTGGDSVFSGKAILGGGIVAGTPVAFDAVAHGSTSAAGTSIPSFNLTIGSITNGAVVCYVSFTIQTTTGIGVTVGGVSATLISGTDSTTTGATYRNMMFGLATGSTTGVQAIAVTWTGSSDASAACASFSGTLQAGPFAHGNASHGASTPASITITSATNDLTLGGVSDESGATPTAPTQTSRWAFRSADFQIGSGGSTAPGAATVTHQWTTTASSWEMSGVDIVHQ